MTTAEQDRQRSPIQDGLGQIAVYVAGVLSKIASDHDLVEVLHDHELLALDAWTEGTDRPFGPSAKTGRLSTRN